jgi:hypothetical protein
MLNLPADIPLHKTIGELTESELRRLAGSVMQSLGAGKRTAEERSEHSRRIALKRHKRTPKKQRSAGAKAAADARWAKVRAQRAAQS